jgi:hypothetical protein
MNKEEFDKRIAKITGELKQLNRDRNEIDEKIMKWQHELGELRSAYVKEMNAEFIGRAYDDKRDGSFIIIRRWDDRVGSLIATEFLSPEVAASKQFMIHDMIVNTSNIIDTSDAFARGTGYTPISMDEFVRRKTEFFNKYIDSKS